MTKEEKHQLSCIEQKHRDGELHWERIRGDCCAFIAAIGYYPVRIARYPTGSSYSYEISVSRLNPNDESDTPTKILLWRKESAGLIVLGTALFGRVAKLWNSVRKIVEEEERKAYEASLAEASAKLCKIA